ncbi:MAG TPA: HD domain-containing phosphohydrolase [Planctomycetota bacterium]|nr:HD domain-containing phosphohydrolase [Planctomycetota bacterium]
MDASSGDVLSGPSNQFFISLAGAINQAQLYEAENKILLAPMARLGSLLQELLSHGPLFSFQSRDQNIFVNDARLRCDGPTFLKHQDFLKQLEVRKISGMAFMDRLNLDQWKVLLYTVARANRKSPQIFEEIQKTLAEKGLAKLVALFPLATAVAPDGVVTESPLPMPPPGPAAAVPGAPGAGAAPGGTAVIPFPRAAGRGTMVRRVKRNPRLFAGRTYVKSMLLLREYYRSLDDRDRLGYCQIRLQRAVFDLVSVCEQEGWRYFGLVNNKKLSDYLYNHSVNVTVLSLILGLKMSLSRPRLAELAMAAMLHDLGKSKLPRELLEKKGVFSEEERKQLSRHPELGIRALLKAKPYNESLLKRLLVVAEHHRPLQEKADAHAYSRIIAIAETFDALTSDRPYRPAFAPDVAVQMLARLAGEKLDPLLTTAFIQAIGLYPSGTLVELSDHALAIVSHPHPEASSWRMPTVRLLGLKGLDKSRTRLVDLSKPPPSDPARTILRVVDPRPFGISVTGFLLEEPVNDRAAF